MVRYQLFVDDSGNREYATDRQYGIVGKSLHFVYGSILLEQPEAIRLTTGLRDLKQVTFGRADVEVKSNWIRQPRERRIRYLEPFDLTEEKLDKFTDDYYRLLLQARLDLIGSVVNKLHIQQEYEPPRVPWYAPTMAYDALLQRAVRAVPDGSTLAVTIDNISGKTPHQNEYKDLLLKHHASLKARGSKLRMTQA